MDQQQTSWVVTMDETPHRLTAGSEGLTLRESDGDDVTHWSWDDVRQVMLPNPFTVEVVTPSGVVALGLHAGSIQRELRAVLEEHGVTVRTPSSPADTVLDQVDRANLQPPKYVDGSGYLAVGLGVTLIGVLLLVVSADYESSPRVEDQGVSLADVLGMLLLTVGGVVLSIGIVAVGVTAGIRRAVDLMGPVSTWGTRTRRD